ncbi:cell wall integrity and stress response component 2, partial [Biomphalaria pfeifferi]
LPRPSDDKEIKIQQVIFMVELFAVLSLILWGISLFVEHIQLIIGYEKKKLEAKRDILFHQSHQ